MTRRSHYGVAVAALIVGAALPQVAAAQAASPAKAQATIKDAQGKEVGRAMLTQEIHGVLLRAELSGLPPGPHGFHLHALAKCEPPAFTSAGGHFNPTGRKHGYNAEAGPHGGDLPNVIAGPDGKATVEIWVADISLGAGQVAATAGAATSGAGATSPPAEHNIFDQGGASLIIHAKADDYASDPAGNAGDRIACGVIEK
jgi:Cu-Zn family superoxide dismutase